MRKPKTSRVYCCYSKPQMEFLKENGLDSDCKGRSTTTDNIFWVYVRDEKLNELLNMWSLGQKS